MNARHAVYLPFFEALTDGVGISDESGGILYLNPAAEGILKVELPAVRGRSLCELLCGSIAASSGGNAGCPLRYPGGEEKAVTYQFRVDKERAFRWNGSGVHKSDQWSHVRVRCLKTLMPWLDGEAGEKHLTIIEDVSAQIEMERHKEDWRNMIAHDLRTPLTTIYASMRLLQDAFTKQSEAPPEAKYIEMSVRNCRRVVELLNLYLDVAKLDAGMMPVKLSAVGLAETVSLAVDEQKVLAKEKRIEVALDVPPDLAVRADAELFSRVAQNILSNALKFTPEGGRVRIEARRAQPGAVILSVTDTGLGISAEELPRVFDRYHQADARRAGTIIGTGLGLAFCCEALKAMAGSIEVKSKLGAGSVFSVHLPEEA